ncbi:MAG: formate--tetrahydrofolate ligase, partial [Weissella cibaria]
MQTDIEIAQAAEVWPIEKIAEKAGLTPAEWEPYGRDKAKISVDETAHKAELGK